MLFPPAPLLAARMEPTVIVKVVEELVLIMVVLVVGCNFFPVSRKTECLF